MFVKMADAGGDVCVNMNTGLRFRPMTDDKTGLRTGVRIIFPDGNTNIVLRAGYEQLADIVQASEGR